MALRVRSCPLVAFYTESAETCFLCSENVSIEEDNKRSLIVSADIVDRYDGWIILMRCFESIDFDM